MRVSNIAAVLAATAAWFACQLATDSDADNAMTPQELRLSDEISGWTEDSAQYEEFDQRQLYELMDGGADEYNRKGMRTGIQQVLNSSNSRSVLIFIMDFGTEDSAVAMYEARKGVVSDPDSMEGFSLDDGCIDMSNFDGCIGYAHIGVFYSMCNFMGFAGSKPDAVASARLFLNTFKSKVQ